MQWLLGTFFIYVFQPNVPATPKHCFSSNRSTCTGGDHVRHHCCIHIWHIVEEVVLRETRRFWYFVPSSFFCKLFYLLFSDLDKTKLANKFHEVSMQEAMVNFSTRYTNNDGRIFILFTPVNSFTESIMARVRVLLLDERSLAKNPLETYPAATIKNGIVSEWRWN